MRTTERLFIFEEDRFKSFKSWPFDNTNACNVKKMAEAGFYFSGSEKDLDTVACFVCGKVLDGWEPTDDPWFEHQKHAPQCGFVKLGKCENDLKVLELYTMFELVLHREAKAEHDKRKNKFTKILEAQKSYIKNQQISQ